jgi:hypothetical protein
MITPQQIATLKKGNVSKNADKSKVRVPEIFKSASKAQRVEIFKLSGLASPNSFYVIEKTGGVSPKAAISLAQVMGVSPYYLTGEIDSKEPCTDEILGEFFKKCVGGKTKKRKAKTSAASKATKQSAKKAVDKPVKEKATPAKTKAASVKKEKPPVAKSVKPVKKATPAPVNPKAEKVISIDDNSLTKLLEALAIRAKFGGEAEKTYNKVVELLVK